MKIVFANKYWFLKGGAERYMFDLRALLTRHRHEVVPFAMAGERNEPTEWSRYFVSAVQTERVRFDWQGIRTAGRMLYSFEARAKFSRLLGAVKPDIVHAHNIYHQISPSILPAAKRRGIPVVMTAHDYNLIAPNYALFHDGAICERTKPDKYWEAVRHRCVRGSLTASALAAFEKTLQKWLGLYEKNLDRIIAPSLFVKSMLMAYGVEQSKIVHVPHFIDAAAVQPRYGGDYALFVGRLSEEKGADVLVRAAAASGVPVRIVGSGPDEARLRRLAEETKAKSVTFVGAKHDDALRQEYLGARFVAVPSISNETFGLTALEAYAAGKPVLASKIGGLPEVVRDGETGTLAAAGDAASWAEKLRALYDDPLRSERMGRAGRAWVETEFAPEPHYKRIMEVYASAMKR